LGLLLVMLHPGWQLRLTLCALRLPNRLLLLCCMLLLALGTRKVLLL
jgi:hypothetical protein